MVLGGGQDASAVTTTDHRAGKFEAKFFDKVNYFSFPPTLLSNISFAVVLAASIHDFSSNSVSLRFFKRRLEV